MTVKNKISVISLIFGILPLIILFSFGSRSGLSAAAAFHSAMAMALMVSIFAGFFTSNLVRYWLFSNRLENMHAFCQDVKRGKYDVHLSVPNSSTDNADEDELVSLMRDMNWMAHCIKAKQTEIKKTLEDLGVSNAEMQVQKEALEIVNKEQLMVQRRLEEQRQELKEAIAMLRHLMDNVGQGFLTVGSDLKVHGEYSAECVLIFNQEISNASLPELFYPGDLKQQAFLAALLSKIFVTDSTFLRENYLSLLPEELVLDEVYIKVDYKLIEHPLVQNAWHIMAILTDVTEEKNIKSALQEEKNTLAAVVRAVTHYHEFTKAVQEYQLFCEQGITALLQGDCSAKEKIKRIFREVHTWKGIFAQLGLRCLAAHLHELESQLDTVRETNEEAALQQCFTVYSSEVLSGWLAGDIKMLTQFLGESFFSRQEVIEIEHTKLKNLENKVKQMLPACQARLLVAELHKLSYKPFADYLEIYKEHIADLALRQGKKLYPVAIEGDDVWVDPERYYEFSRSLIHVFRNAVSHGLELPEERMAKGKDQAGSLRCTITKTPDFFSILIADDGRGVDWVNIGKMAVEKGVCRAEEIETFTEQDMAQLIFADGFSSEKTVSAISGRGVGLCVVQEQVKKLGGRIEVHSEIGKGSRFLFLLPIEPVAQACYNMADFGKQVAIEVQNSLKEYDIITGERVIEVPATSGIIPMENISTFIDVKGEFSGRLMLSGGVEFVQQLAKHYISPEDEIKASSVWLESVFSEFFNMVVGNSLAEIQVWASQADIGAPLTIWAEDASVKYTGAKIQNWLLKTAFGNVHISVILFEGKDKDGTYFNC